jgi:malonyl CoA-acyl carrier protein transacylase
VSRQTQSFVITTTITSHSLGIFASLARDTGQKAAISEMFLLVAAAKTRGRKHQKQVPTPPPLQALLQAPLLQATIIARPI